MEIDIPKYYLKKDYFADDYIKDRDKTIEELKSDAVSIKSILKHIDKFKPLDDNLITRFEGEYSNVKGEIKFTPVKLRLTTNGGKFHKSVVCDIIIKNGIFFGNEDLEAFKKLKPNSFDAIISIMKDDYYGLEKKFKEIVRLFGMGDYSLSINDIKLIYDE